MAGIFRDYAKKRAIPLLKPVKSLERLRSPVREINRKCFAQDMQWQWQWQWQWQKTQPNPFCLRLEPYHIGKNEVKYR
ncbi:hypothetical protein ED28_02870 [[Pantoea] beijingensis]|uniref:Uncharacterized protein n=1 Tax=[Pantoea] beijingensis TaxID=1324864 RepID=A0A443IGS2_9GAMM|nr:hypothetical protein ED28_02870 [[Pantoea] beijingensis]